MTGCAKYLGRCCKSEELTPNNESNKDDNRKGTNGRRSHVD